MKMKERTSLEGDLIDIKMIGTWYSMLRNVLNYCEQWLYVLFLYTNCTLKTSCIQRVITLIICRYLKNA